MDGCRISIGRTRSQSQRLISLFWDPEVLLLADSIHFTPLMNRIARFRPTFNLVCPKYSIVKGILFFIRIHNRSLSHCISFQMIYFAHLVRHPMKHIQNRYFLVFLSLIIKVFKRLRKLCAVSRWTKSRKVSYSNLGARTESFFTRVVTRISLRFDVI